MWRGWKGLAKDKRVNLIRGKSEAKRRKMNRTDLDDTGLANDLVFAKVSCRPCIGSPPRTEVGMAIGTVVKEMH